MKTRRTLLRFGVASMVAVLLTAASIGAQEDKLKKSELVTLSGDVIAIDVAKREVTLRGPLGGEVIGQVSEDVKNLDQIKVGDLVTIGFYQSMAVTAKRKGESKPIFTGSNSAAAKGDLPGGHVANQTTETVTVISVDPETRSLVVQGDKGNIVAVNVERPEFVTKLADLKAGDQLEVTRTEAYIVSVARPTAGTKPSITHHVTTLVVDNGEVVKRKENTIWVRNQQGKVVKVVVDPKYKFMLDGKEATVFDVVAGTKLTRTSFRVVENTEYEAP